MVLEQHQERECAVYNQIDILQIYSNSLQRLIKLSGIHHPIKSVIESFHKRNETSASEAVLL